MKTQIIKFVERDIDGCGTDVEIMVCVKTEFYSTRDYIERLQSSIKDIKKEYYGEYDTDFLIEESMKRVFGENTDWECISPDLEVMF